MGDPINVFGGGYGVKHLSHAEIEKMKKSMKKVPEIQLKSDIYHDKEMTGVEDILGNLPSPTTPTIEQTIQNEETHPGFTTQIKLIRQRFISLFS